MELQTHRALDSSPLAVAFCAPFRVRFGDRCRGDFYLFDLSFDRLSRKTSKQNAKERNEDEKKKRQTNQKSIFLSLSRSRSLSFSEPAFGRF